MSKSKKLLTMVVCMALALTAVSGLTAFAETTPNGIVYQAYRDHVEITSYSGNTKDLIIPAELGGLPVTVIAKNAFTRRSNLNSVVIPDSVTTIGANAFVQCTGLTSVTFGANVASIGDSAFSYCSSLASVTIPEKVTKIAGSTFSDCSRLASVTMGTNVTEVGGQAFHNCSALTDVYYTGSESDWNKITVYNDYNYNAPLVKAIIHYNYVPETAATGQSSNGIAVKVNGRIIDFDVPPMAVDGTTMLPVRMALEPLGAEFVWNGANNTVTITAEGKVIQLIIGSDTAYVDGIAKIMTQPAMAVDGRTLIPIRFVAENLGYKVDWDGNTNTVIITG